MSVCVLVESSARDTGTAGDCIPILACGQLLGLSGETGDGRHVLCTMRSLCRVLS